jgi:hypothetical protein
MDIKKLYNIDTYIANSLFDKCQAIIQLFKTFIELNIENLTKKI